MKAVNRSPRIRRLTQRAAQLGYTVRYVEFCNDSRTPSMHLIRGVCDPKAREIRVALHGATREIIEAVLSHELEHAEGKERGTDYPHLGLRCGGLV